MKITNLSAIILVFIVDIYIYVIESFPGYETNRTYGCINLLEERDVESDPYDLASLIVQKSFMCRIISY